MDIVTACVARSPQESNVFYFHHDFAMARNSADREDFAKQHEEFDELRQELAAIHEGECLDQYGFDCLEEYDGVFEPYLRICCRALMLTENPRRVLRKMRGVVCVRSAR